jgi:Chaperone of endosialidase
VTAGSNLVASTGDVSATRGSVVAASNVSAGSNVRAALDVTAARHLSASSNVTAGGNVSASSNVTAGSNVSAAFDVAATRHVSAGSNVSATFDVTATRHVTAGSNVSATFDVAAGRSITAGSNVTATFDVAATRHVTAGSNVSATFDVAATRHVTAGSNVSATFDVAAGRSITAGSNVTATFDVAAARSVTAGSNVTATFDVAAARSVTAGSNVTAAFDVVAGSNVRAGSNVSATFDVEARCGNVRAGSNITAGSNVTAAWTLTAGSNLNAAYAYVSGAATVAGSLSAGALTGGAISDALSATSSTTAASCTALSNTYAKALDAYNRAASTATLTIDIASNSGLITADKGATVIDGSTIITTPGGYVYKPANVCTASNVTSIRGMTAVTSNTMCLWGTAGVGRVYLTPTVYHDVTTSPCDVAMVVNTSTNTCKLLVAIDNQAVINDVAVNATGNKIMIVGRYTLNKPPAITCKSDTGTTTSSFSGWFPTIASSLSGSFMTCINISDGTGGWATATHVQSLSGGAGTEAKAVCVDGNGDTYVAGSYSATTDNAISWYAATTKFSDALSGFGLTTNFKATPAGGAYSTYVVRIFSNGYPIPSPVTMGQKASVASITIKSGDASQGSVYPDSISVSGSALYVAVTSKGNSVTVFTSKTTDMTFNNPSASTITPNAATQALVKLNTGDMLGAWTANLTANFNSNCVRAGPAGGVYLATSSVSSNADSFYLPNWGTSTSASVRYVRGSTASNTAGAVFKYSDDGFPQWCTTVYSPDTHLKLSSLSANSDSVSVTTTVFNDGDPPTASAGVLADNGAVSWPLLSGDRTHAVVMSNNNGRPYYAVGVEHLSTAAATASGFAALSSSNVFFLARSDKAIWNSAGANETPTTRSLAGDTVVYAGVSSAADVRPLMMLFQRNQLAPTMTMPVLGVAAAAVDGTTKLLLNTTTMSADVVLKTNPVPPLVLSDPSAYTTFSVPAGAGQQLAWYGQKWRQISGAVGASSSGSSSSGSSGSSGGTGTYSSTPTFQQLSVDMTISVNGFEIINDKRSMSNITNLAMTGVLSNAGGALALTGATPASTVAFVGGTPLLDGSRNLSNVGALSMAGPLTNAGTTSLTATSGTVLSVNGQPLVDAARNLTNVSALTLSGALTSTAGTVALNNAAPYTAAVLSVNGTSVLDGLRNLTGLNNVALSGSLSNTAGALVFGATGAATVLHVGGAPLVDASRNVVNAGNLTMSGVLSNANALVLSSGTAGAKVLYAGGQPILDTGRNLSNVNGLSAGGAVSLTASAGTVLSVGGTQLLDGARNFTNVGNVTMAAGGVLSNTAGITTSGALSAASLTLSGTLSAASLTLSGTLSAASLTLSGAMTAASLSGAAISDSTASTLSSVAASSKAVKAAYDLASTAYARADTPASLTVNGTSLSAPTTVASTGYIGVGIANPLYPVHVAAKTAADSVSVYCDGDVSFQSDRRVKRDLRLITDALAKVRAIGGYTYLMRRTAFGAGAEGEAEEEEADAAQRPPQRRRLGLVAQEVQQQLPEAVSEAPDGRLSVAYGNMVALLVEAVKELADEVAALRAAQQQQQQ